MSDIFNEIEEDLRKERLERLWKRYGPFAIAVAVIVVLGVSGWRGWEWYAHKQAQDAGAQYAAAMALSQDGKYAEAEAAFAALAAESPSGYELLARFRAASELARTDKAGAAARLDEISNDISVPANLRDLARIRAAYLLVDTAGEADVRSRVEPMAAAGNAWRHSAREILALAAWKAGDVANARRWAQELISDAEAPPGARARGQLLLDLAAGAAAPPAP